MPKSDRLDLQQLLLSLPLPLLPPGTPGHLLLQPGGRGVPGVVPGQQVGGEGKPDPELRVPLHDGAPHAQPPDEPGAAGGLPADPGRVAGVHLEDVDAAAGEVGRRDRRHVEAGVPGLGRVGVHLGPRGLAQQPE